MDIWEPAEEAEATTGDEVDKLVESLIDPWESVNWEAIPMEHPESSMQMHEGQKGSNKTFNLSAFFKKANFLFLKKYVLLQMKMWERYVKSICTSK